MKVGAYTIVVVLLAAIFASTQTFSPVGHGGVFLLSSPDAPGLLLADHMNKCLQQLAREWKLDAQSLPTVIVYHVSERTAQAVKIEGKIAVRRNRSVKNAGDSYYEVWLVGEPATGADVLTFQNILEQHFNLIVTEAKRNEVIRKVSLYQNATVSAYQGK